TLTGSSSSSSLAYSPDGKQLASGSYKTVQIWDTSNWTCLQSITGHNENICSIAYSPDGSRLASGSLDKTIKIWNTSNGVCLKTLTDTNFITSVAYSPDGSQLASGSYDCTIKIWDTASGSCQKTLTGHPGRVFSVAFSPDGNILASGSAYSSLKIWDVSSGACLQSMTTSVPESVAFSPDGSSLASGSYDGSIGIWDTSNWTCLQTLTGHTNPVYSVAFSPTGNKLASGGYDFTIRIWSKSGASNSISVTGVNLNESSLTLTAGQSETLTAIVSPTNATNKNVNWRSNDNNVATVSSAGLVMAVSEGTAIITATSADGYKSASCTVSVIQANDSNIVDWVAQTGVPCNKVWTIKFNTNVSSDTINRSYIYASQESDGGSIVYGSNTLASTTNPSWVLVSPPDSGWQAGGTYYLFIKDTVKSTSGKMLGNTIRMRFVILN
ncbi:MAG: Ig-like domain-containing protein, partial [Syntrophomonas sp.]